MSKKHPVIGIDLGTTYSAVAAYNQYTEQTEVLFDGKSQTVPSVISLYSGKVIVGEKAQRNLAFDPANTVIEIKREMGEVFRTDTLIKFGGDQAGFRASDPQNNIDGDPVRVLFAGLWMLPQELSAFILMKLKQVAEQDFGEEILDAVITVPAYFTEKQKKATEEAALLAGLYPRQLIAEPTAAAICYGVDRAEQTRKVYLIYDLGGGTFDVSIISVEGTNIDVIATSGDPRLGGSDLDDLITAWAVEQLKFSHRLDVGGIARSRSLIKYFAEKLKCELSVSTSAKMTLSELRPENPPILELTRIEFEKMIDPLLAKSISYIDLALKTAGEKGGLRREDINAILLVGGSSKIPRVKARLLDYFGKEDSFVRADCDPDAVVARGAALLALKFQPSPGPFDISRSSQGGINAAPEIDLLPQLITEHSLGIAVEQNMQQNIFHKLIDQGSRIPISVKHENFTNSGPYRTVDVRIYQGEGNYVFENTLIGTLELGPMEVKPENFHKFNVTFELDQNGLLKTKVYHVNENKTYEGKYNQKTGIGGLDKLRLARESLLKLWSDVTPVGMPPKPFFANSPPSPNPYLPSSPTEIATPMPAEGVVAADVPSPAPAMETVPESVASAPAEPPMPAPTELLASAPAPSTPAQALASNGIVAATREIPEAYKSILRRSEKTLLRTPNQSLLAAHNALVTALNSEISGADLDNLHDALEDAYLDSRG